MKCKAVHPKYKPLPLCELKAGHRGKHEAPVGAGFLQWFTPYDPETKLEWCVAGQHRFDQNSTHSIPLRSDDGRYVLHVCADHIEELTALSTIDEETDKEQS